MVKSTLLTTAALLLISACSPETSDENTTPATVTPQTNTPFDLASPGSDPATNTPTEVPVTVSPTVTTPQDSQLPIFGTDTQFPMTPANPGNAPTVVDNGGASFSTQALINGDSVGSVDSFWRCAEPFNTDPAAIFDLGFYGDMTASLSIGDQTGYAYWNLSGNAVQMGENLSQGVELTLSNIVFVDGAEFEAILEISGSSAEIFCELFDTNANPVNPADNQPPQVSAPPVVSETPSNMLSVANSSTLASLDNFWVCDLSTGEQVALAFAADGTGSLVADPAEDAIDIGWDQSQEISILLENGDSIDLSTPIFNDANSFTVSNVWVNGDIVGSMSCARYDLDGNPV